MPRAPTGLSPPFFFLLMAALASIANTTITTNNNNYNYNRNDNTAKSATATNANTTTTTTTTNTTTTTTTTTTAVATIVTANNYNRQQPKYSSHHRNHHYYRQQQQQQQFDYGYRVGSGSSSSSRNRNGRSSRNSRSSSNGRASAEAATAEVELPSPLEVINPWLSACDLQPASATDLQGACTTAAAGPGSQCPPPCPANNTTQCLHYLQESHKERLCGEMNPQRRQRELQGLRMRHCCEHAVDSALADPHLEDAAACRDRLDALLEVDALAARVSCEFAEILTRYDCTQTYSIKYNCEDCKEAYRRWVCSSLVPHFTSPGHRVRPCLNVCQNVEKQCPYMLPGDRAPAHPTQYAGEPTFLCLDTNIPETGEQRSKSSHGDEDCCYTHCGTPGRGLCARCTNATATEGTPPGWVQCSTPATQRTPACRSSGAQRTYSRKVVHPLWTAWIILVHTQTIINMFKCLLAVCAASVTRTTFFFFDGGPVKTEFGSKTKRQDGRRRKKSNGRTSSSSWS